MRKVYITESQFSRLFEGGDSIFLDGNDSTKRFDSEVSAQAMVTDKDGDEKMSRPVTSNDFADTQSVQQWGAIGQKSYHK
jgi:hypothetical protein